MMNHPPPREEGDRSHIGGIHRREIQAMSSARIFEMQEALLHEIHARVRARVSHRCFTRTSRPAH